MKLIQSVVASAALLAGMAASSANAYVAFLRTDLTPYAKLESYPSLGELASNSNGAIASNITPSIPVINGLSHQDCREPSVTKPARKNPTRRPSRNFKPS